jgi:hypothetical protein
MAAKGTSFGVDILGATSIEFLNFSECRWCLQSYIQNQLLRKKFFVSINVSQ